MYLQKLYRHHKYWFIAIVCFIGMQLFINYKHGVVFTPFYHYGMYSEVISPGKNYTVTEIVVNGQVLSACDFTPNQWDNLVQPVEKYYLQKNENPVLWETDIRRLIPFTDSAKFLNQITDEQFRRWYHRRLEAITGKQVNDYTITFTGYRFINNRLTKSN